MIEYQPTWRYAVTATMNIARNTRDIPINGIFANRSIRAMRPTSIDRMTVIPVNTFRRCGGGEMEVIPAAPVGGDPVEQQVCRRVGLLLEHPVADAVQGFPNGIRRRCSDRTAEHSVARSGRRRRPDERRWAGYLVANSPGFSCGSA